MEYDGSLPASQQRLLFERNVYRGQILAPLVGRYKLNCHDKRQLLIFKVFAQISQQHSKYTSMEVSSLSPPSATLLTTRTPLKQKPPIRLNAYGICDGKKSRDAVRERVRSKSSLDVRLSSADHAAEVKRENPTKNENQQAEETELELVLSTTSAHR
ncbi:hypothetical protein LSTR_LSTR001784 [Laodelphax striatellus]|uniref:Uncharacterized protein n=1 Tax=Laodelphax striatellus TaxID=195883 RepID=A0A482WG53_LAOST|nr:hypothetical protein LSTR_LSTR001784 [Laodelphax striatellus]